MANRVDANQKEIVRALTAAPRVSVQDLSAVGQGCPDLLVGTKVRITDLMYLADEDGLIPYNFLLEVKDGSKPPSRQKLNDRQETWHGEWKGQAGVVNSLTKALETIGALPPRESK